MDSKRLESLFNGIIHLRPGKALKVRNKQNLKEV